MDVDLAELLQPFPLGLGHVEPIDQHLHAPLAPSCGQKRNYHSHARRTEQNAPPPAGSDPGTNRDHSLFAVHERVMGRLDRSNFTVHGSENQCMTPGEGQCCTPRQLAQSAPTSAAHGRKIINIDEAWKMSPID